MPPAASGEPLVEPVVLASVAGRLKVTLTASGGASLAGLGPRALGYNGTSPGPTLRMHPGDVLAVRLVNNLETPTNLHTHGLRVSPEGRSDNPFVRVDPGDTFDYSYRIPPDHPAGTAWYHPHHHGTVADQIFGGLMGALIIDGGPRLPVSEDRVLMLSDTTPRADGSISPASQTDRMLGREGTLVLVNGRHQPRIEGEVGAAQRWRLVNGCTSRVLDLRLPGHEMVLVALDGSPLAAPAGVDRVLLAPGNRADVVVRPVAGGSTPLIAEPFDRGGMGMMRSPGDGRPFVVATLNSSPATSPPTPALPATLPAERIPPGLTTVRRELVLGTGMGMGGRGGMEGMGGMGPGMFSIDGRGFDHGRDDQVVRAGSIEEWTIRNPGPLAHPFHLHVWPFTVLATADGPAPAGPPRDVVLVPAGGWVRLRIPFTANTGRSVYHCHVLDHEDAGMMGTINVR